MDLSFFFAGTAGSVPTARRGLPALLLRAGGDRILFDCGEGTQQQLLRSAGLPELDAIIMRAMAKNRMIAYIPVLSRAADSMALAGLGASAWASGSQVCIGARPTLVP